jgi:excisionase family DNA binding protein
MLIENSHKPEKPSIDIQVPQKEKLALTPAEAAELLGMSVNSVYRLLHEGKIPSVKLGMERKFLIPRGELIKILTSGEIIK